MDMDPQDFLDVPLNQNQPHRCSPTQKDPRWRGVLIRAPSRVSFKEGESVGDRGTFAAIPICGYFHMDLRLDIPLDPMLLVAVDRKTKQVFSGPIVELDESPEIPPPDELPVTEEQIKGMAGGGYFNPNLADFVELPQVSATYDVHLEYRGFDSNVVTIELVKEP
jgi:hypothetical protein